MQGGASRSRELQKIPFVAVVANLTTRRQNTEEEKGLDAIVVAAIAGFTTGVPNLMTCRRRAIFGAVQSA